MPTAPATGCAQRLQGHAPAVGYENSAVKVMGIDRCPCPEKLVQAYSRANRRAHGLPVPLILDFQNHAKQVEEAIFQFSTPRMCLACGDATEVAAHSARIRELAQPVLGKPKAAHARVSAMAALPRKP